MWPDFQPDARSLDTGLAPRWNTEGGIQPADKRYYGGRRRDELDIVAWINGQLMEFRYAETPRR